MERVSREGDPNSLAPCACETCSPDQDKTDLARVGQTGDKILTMATKSIVVVGSRRTSGQHRFIPPMPQPKSSVGMRFQGNRFSPSPSHEETREEAKKNQHNKIAAGDRSLRVFCLGELRVSQVVISSSSFGLIVHRVPRCL